MSLRVVTSASTSDVGELEVVVRRLGADVQHVLRLATTSDEVDLRRVVAAVYSAVQGLVTNDELRTRRTP